MSATNTIIVYLIILGSLLLASGCWLLLRQRNTSTTNDDLLYTLTHDELANPLQSALATLDNLERRNSDIHRTNKKQDNAIDHAEMHGNSNQNLSDFRDLRLSLQKLSGTTRNLRELAMLNMPARARLRERVNLVSIVQRMVVDLGPITEKQSIRLLYEGADSAIYVLQHEHTLQRILGNVLDNAIKYCADVEKPCVVISVSEANRCASIVISDNGTGMTPERCQSLGQAPQKPTAHNIGTQGSGIGLYLVYRLLEQNDGQISVSSEITRGTIVSIQLPLASAHGKTEPSA